MGFKTAGFPHYGFNPLGFRTSGSIISELKKAGAVLALLSTKADGSAPLTGNNNPWNDLAEAETDGGFKGDGVAYKQFDNFNDANLGENFSINCVFKVGSFELGGVYGFDNGGSESFYLQTRDVLGGFIASVWGDTKFISSSTQVGDIVEFDLVVNGLSYEWFLNDVSVATGTFTKNVSNKPLQILTKGDLTDRSSHTFKKIKVVNTDTNSILLTVDYSKQNVGTLTNFAGTASSGWNNVTNFDVNVVENYDFSEGISGWSTQNANISADNKILTMLATAPLGTLKSNPLSFDINNVCFAFAKVYSSSNNVKLISYVGSIDVITNHSGSSQYEELYHKFTATSTVTNNDFVFTIRDDRVADWDNVLIDGDVSKGGGCFFINLTKLDAFFGTTYASQTAEQINAIKYDLLALQKYADVLTFDGVDDYLQFADTPSLDITTAPLAIGVTCYLTSSNTEFLICKNATDAFDVQYGVLQRVGPTLEFYKTGVTYAQFNASFNNYINIVFYWDGVNVTGYLNGNLESSNVLSGNLTTSGLLRVGSGLNFSVPDFLYEGNIATATIYTGSDINKILAVEAKISAPYLALNP